VDGLTDGTYFTVSAQGANGTAAIDATTGEWTFTPAAPDWFGSDSFTVTVTDDEGGTTTQVVNITLANVDDPAVISGDISYTGPQVSFVMGDLNATDVDGLIDGSYFTVSAQGTHGSASIDSATGAWFYFPFGAGWPGSDSFTVTVTDDLGGTTIQVVNITMVG
jgi:VCBS repeat-containing protein